MNPISLDLRGVHHLSMDAKGRLAIPTKYRQQGECELESEFVLTIDTEDSCLVLYPNSQWQGIQQRLTQLSSFKPAAKRLKRLLMGYATDMSPDASGRILIPPPLRDHAKLGKKVVLLGQGNKFELWDEQIWQQQCQAYLDAPLSETELKELEDLAL